MVKLRFFWYSKIDIFTHTLEKNKKFTRHLFNPNYKQIRENVAYRWKWGNLMEKKDAVEKVNKIKSRIFERIISNGFFWNICQMN